jgi:hypothetical protein
VFVSTVQFTATLQGLGVHRIAAHQLFGVASSRQLFDRQLELSVGNFRLIQRPGDLAQP